MLSTDLLDIYNSLLNYPENLPAATILLASSEALDRDTFITIKTAFDNYIKSVQSSKFNRELALAVYKAFLTYQSDVMEDQEIINMLEVCYELIQQDNQVTSAEADEIHENFYPILASRADNHYFVAKSLELLQKIYLATLKNSPPTAIKQDSISGEHFYHRLMGYRLEDLSVLLEGLNFTLPEDLEDNKIYDIFTEVTLTEDLPIFSAYLAEVGSYDNLNVKLYDNQKVLNKSDELTFKFEVPIMKSADGKIVTCQTFSYDTELWMDTQCDTKVEDDKVKITTNTLGVYRLQLVDHIPETQTESLCEMNPAPYAIVCTLFGLVILMFIISILSRTNKLETYQFSNISNETHKKNKLSGFEKSSMSPNSSTSNRDEIHPPVRSSSTSSFFNQHILADILKNQDPVEKINHMLSLLTSMFFGYAVLGAFNYAYGDIEDNSEDTFSDVAHDYYPMDLKYVCIALALVIPVALPLRLMTKIPGIAKLITLVFTIVILVGSILGVLLMGAYFCQGAAMRWTLSFLIYIPLELATSEFMIATVLFVAGRR